MKKIVILLFVVMAAISAKAQVYLGGNLSLWHNDDADATTFTLAPEIGYEINDKWAVGAVIEYSHGKYGKDLNIGLGDLDIDIDGKLKVNAFAFAPYARFSFYENKVLRLFIDGGIGVSTVKGKIGDWSDDVTGWELGIKPGIAIKLNQHFSFVTKYGFLGYRDDYMLNTNNGYGFGFSSEDLSIGFHYAF